MFAKYYNQIQNHDRNYPNLLLPEDCIYLMRLLQFEDFCNLVVDTIQKSGKSEKDVLLAIKATITETKQVFNFVGRAIEYIIEVNTKDN